MFVKSGAKVSVFRDRGCFGVLLIIVVLQKQSAASLKLQAFKECSLCLDTYGLKLREEYQKIAYIRIISLNFAFTNVFLKNENQITMKSKMFRSVLIIAALCMTALSFSSCNRGYGCPTNFSMQSAAGAVISCIAD